MATTDFDPADAERLNRLTHAAGTALAVPAAAALVWRATTRADAVVAVGCFVYGAALVSVYLCSTLSHCFDDRPRVKGRWKVADQVSIFALIAGTMTPFVLADARHPLGLAALGTMWSACLVGMAVRVVRRGTCLSVWEVGYCVAIGWVPLVLWRELFATGGVAGMACVLLGGVAYSGGTWFLMNEHRHVAAHAVWHVCTISGSAAHFAFAWFWVVT
ncbi:MAG: hemolysin III family protein [Planctomycetota bacterium]